MRIKNWKKLQHFKDRTPPWIKLYRDVLDDPDWHALNGDDAKVLIMLWLIASEDETHQGQLPDMRRLAFRLRIEENQLKQHVINLSHWMILDDIEEISRRYQIDTPEGETERETKTEEEKNKRESKSREEGREKPTRGSRLPADHPLTDEWLNEAMRIRQDLPPDRIRAVYAEFYDYWIAQPGQKGIKTDWLATWRNWVRRERGFNRGSQIVKSEKFDPTRYVNDKDYAADWDARKNGGGNGRIIDIEAA